MELLILIAIAALIVGAFLFPVLSKRNARERKLKEELYEQVAAELKSGVRKDGLWAEAIAKSDGRTEQATGTYIKLRVQSLKNQGSLDEGPK